MKVIPNRGHRSQGEKKVRELLSQIESPESVALWSVNLPEHDYKPFSEIDFLIVSPKSLLVLEVKGGRVKYEAETGWWYFGADEQRSESPFDQAGSAQAALFKYLQKQPDFDENLIKNIPFGWGVILTDSDIPSGHMLEKKRLLQGSELHGPKNLHKFLRSLEAYSIERLKVTNILNNPQKLKKNELIRVRKYLRRSFEVFPKLSVSSREFGAEIVKATEDQMGYIETIENNDRVLCEGGAGTGKTQLAVKAALDLSENNKTCFAFRSSSYKEFIQECLQTNAVNLLCMEEHEDLAPDVYDLLIVDEGQDLLNADYLDKLDRILIGGLDRGKCLWFMDSNYQTRLYEDIDFSYKTFLDGFVKVPLVYNCRNTKPVSDYIVSLTGANMGRPRVGGGPDVSVFTKGNTKNDQAIALEKHINNCISEGIYPGQITILSPEKKEDSCVNLLDRNLKRKIGKEGKREREINKIEYFRIVDFKGQENEFIVLLDLYNLEDNETTNSLLYTALSRANICVWICISEDSKKTWRIMLERNLNKV